MLNLAADVLKHVPEIIDYEATAKLVADDMNPLNVVLLQEVLHPSQLKIKISDMETYSLPNSYQKVTYHCL